MDKEEFEINNDIKQLPLVAERLESFCERNSIPLPVLFDMNLAVDEVVTNVISYAYGDKGNGTVFIGMYNDRERKIFKIVIKDSGAEFDPLAKSDPDLELALEEKPIGGLGIYLVKKKTDNLFYERKKGFNILTLEKVY